MSAAHAQAAERVMDAVRDLDRALPGTDHGFGDELELSEPVSNFPKEAYKEAVEKARADLADKEAESERLQAALDRLG